MFTQKIELMGLEYVLMLGVWWGAMVIVTVVAMAIKRSVTRWYEHRQGTHAAASTSLDA